MATKLAPVTPGELLLEEFLRPMDGRIAAGRWMMPTIPSDILAMFCVAV